MSASPQATLVAFLMAAVLLTANVARTSMARPDARWTVLTTGLVGFGCAALAALDASTGW
jgi:hypothetical protein